MIKSIAIDDPNIFSICKNSLDKCGVIIYPTDTLYGFGVDARNENAIKKINTDGQIVEHLDREEYIRLSTPSKATIGMIKSYFDKYAVWSFNKFMALNSSYYDQYKALEPEVYLESK